MCFTFPANQPAHLEVNSIFSHVRTTITDLPSTSWPAAITKELH